MEDAGEEILDVADEHFVINPYTAHLIIKDYEYLSDKKRVFEPRMLTQASPNYAKAYKALEQEKGADAINISREANALYSATMMRDLNQGHARMRFKGGNNIADEYLFIANTVLYKNQDDTWIDGATQDASGQVTSYTFGSDDYYAFASQFPETTEFLKIGQKMRILVRDNIYEIVEAPAEEEEKK